MSRKLALVLAAVLIAVAAIGVSSIVYVSDASAQSKSATKEVGVGPWMVSADGVGGYLVNTSTGEVWRLKDDVKYLVRDATK